jgi:hypothetical protein
MPLTADPVAALVEAAADLRVDLYAADDPLLEIMNEGSS